LVRSPLQHLFDIALVHLLVLVKDTGLFVRKRMPGHLLFILKEHRWLTGVNWRMALALTVEHVPRRNGSPLIRGMHVILGQLVLEDLRLGELVVVLVLLTVTDGLAVVDSVVVLTMAAIATGLRARRIFRKLIIGVSTM